MFIATANTTDTIPPALLDRMEVIEVPGYTIDEKIAIANAHLIPKVLSEHGLSSSNLCISSKAIEDICDLYAPEPGVRGLERELQALCRHAAVRLVEGATVCTRVYVVNGLLKLMMSRAPRSYSPSTR